MSNNIRIHASLKDDVSQPVQGIHGKLSNLGAQAKSSILTGVGLGAGVSAFNMLGSAAGMAVDYLKDAVTAAREETVSVALMTTSLRENSAAFDGNLDAIEKVIKERMALGFADDEQRTSLGQLTSVTKDHEKALELQRTAMDLARLKGMSLQGATELLGKVYAGNLGILSRYGIVLEDGATATEAIAEIQRRAAGQAEAWANTEEGAAQTASLAFGELSEQIGTMLLPVITELAKFARDTLVPALSAVVDNAETIGEVIGHLPFLSMALQMGEMVAKEKAALEAETAAIAAEKAKQQAAIDAQGAAWEARYRQMYPVIADIAAEIAYTPRRFIEAELRPIRDAAYQSAVSYAKGLIDGQDAPKVAMDALIQIQEEALTRSAETARLLGQLNSAELAAGLADARPAVNAQALATRLAILNQLSNLGVDTRQYGFNAGMSFAAGMDAAYGYVRTAAGGLAAAVRGQIGINSEPSDPTSPLRGITKWGGNIAHELGKGMLGGAGGTRGAAGALAGGVAGGGGNQTIQLVVDGRVLAQIVNAQNAYSGGPPSGPLGRG